ncbi:MAG: hypothetical protein WAK10_05810 [Methanoregula sp.]
MKPIYENIPPLLRRLNRWVVWKYEERNGKKTKPPYVPTTGRIRNAMVNIPGTWGSLEQAKKAFETGTYDGIGFVLGEGIIGFDVDHATDAMIGEALSLGTYTEQSPGGLGIHVIGQSDILTAGRRKGNVEFYMQGRYFTVTGDILPGSPADVMRIPDILLHEYLKRHFDIDT